MALDLQAILNEAVSEVLEKKEEETKDSVTEPIGEADNSATGGESKEDFKEKVVGAVKKGYDAVKDTAGAHPYLTAATGALAAGAGALGLRKMIRKRGGLKK